MNLALLGKWDSSADAFQHPAMATSIPETVEAEVIDPAEAGGKKWSAHITSFLLDVDNCCDTFLEWMPIFSTLFEYDNLQTCKILSILWFC